MLKNVTLLISAFMAIAVAQTPLPASPEGVLRSNARLVALDVLVNNDKGSVRGLTKDDFILEDKGKKQTIALFEVTEPGKSPGTPLERGVASNRLNSKGEIPSSATVILYDRINAPSPEAQAFVRGQVLKLLAGLKETDRVGFYSLGFNLQIVSDYDQDPTALARVAKALQSSGNPPAGFSAPDTALFKGLVEALGPMQQPSNQARVNITYPAFRSIARHMAGVPGRKNLVWVASVFPLTFGNQQERRKNDQAEVDAFRNNLTEANIAIYPVDPGGTGASFNQTDAAPVANEGSLMPGAMRNAAGTSSATNSANSQTGNQTMLVLADATGGKAYRNANDIEPALREVVSQSGYTYTLGFYPDEKTLDNKTHDLKVTFVKKKETEKAKAIHRKMYFAWGPSSPPDVAQKPSLGEILSDPLPANSIGLLAVTNPVPAKPGAQALNIRISAEDLQFVPKGDQFTAAFDIGIAIEGVKEVSLKTYSPTLTAEQMRQVLTNGLDTGETLETNGAAGAFRIAILDRATGAAGSLRVPFAATK